MQQNQFSVTDAAPVAIFTGPGHCLVQNATGSALFLGGPGVTISDGALLNASLPGLQLELSDNATLYAIAQTGATIDTRVLSWY